jgi:hypothetical protein
VTLLWQRFEQGQPVGDPGPLPGGLQGIAASELLDLGVALHADWTGVGYAPAPPPVAVPEPRWMSQADFKRRLTAAERIAIRAARPTDPIIDDFLDILDSTINVNLDDPDLVAGLGYMVATGLLGAERPAQIRD